MEINITKINLNPNAGGGGNSGGDAKIKLPNGICLSGSTWDTFDVTTHDWSNVRDFAFMFSNCKNLTTIDLSGWTNKHIGSIARMFNECNVLAEINGIKNFDISEVSDLSYAFYNCKKLKSIDVSNWDTSKVTNMDNMFSGCHVITEIKGLENFDTSNVTKMGGMFDNCSKLKTLDLRGWDFSNKPGISRMFLSCNDLTDIWIDGDLSYVTAVQISTGFLPNLTNSGHRGTFHYNPQYDISTIRSNSSGWDFVPIE